jgi:uncharacterized protein DUF4157
VLCCAVMGQRLGAIRAPKVAGVPWGVVQRYAGRSRLPGARRDLGVEHTMLPRDYSWGASVHGAVPGSVPNVLGTGGRPLDHDLRTAVETRFGHDFSSVRVHSDAAAARSAADVGAAAYTVGEHVVFGEDRFRPQSAEGRRLLAHELAHVVQQNGPVPQQLRLGGPHDSATEREARAAEITAGADLPSPPIRAVSQIALARQDEPGQAPGRAAGLCRGAAPAGPVPGARRTGKCAMAPPSGAAGPGVVVSGTGGLLRPGG